MVTQATQVRRYKHLIGDELLDPSSGQQAAYGSTLPSTTARSSRPEAKRPVASGARRATRDWRSSPRSSRSSTAWASASRSSGWTRAGEDSRDE